MALSGDQDKGCPHCPPAEEQEHGAHHQPADDASGEAHCVSGSGDCSLSDELNHDGRYSQLKLNDHPVDVPIAISDWSYVADTPVAKELAGVCRSRSPPPDSSPPLNVLYCVYLD